MSPDVPVLIFADLGGQTPFLLRFFDLVFGTPSDFEKFSKIWAHKEFGGVCMKLILLVAMLAGLFTPLRGQQQWCFSTNCPDTPATSFGLDRTDKQLNKIFRTLPTLPAYKPVAPLALSPSTRQFFRYSVPTEAGYFLGQAGFRNAPALVETSRGRHVAYTRPG